MTKRIPRFEFMVTKTVARTGTVTRTETHEMRVTDRDAYSITKKKAALKPDRDCAVTAFIVTEVATGQTFDCTDQFKRDLHRNFPVG